MRVIVQQTIIIVGMDAIAKAVDIDISIGMHTKRLGALEAVVRYHDAMHCGAVDGYAKRSLHAVIHTAIFAWSLGGQRRGRALTADSGEGGFVSKCRLQKVIESCVSVCQ